MFRRFGLILFSLTLTAACSASIVITDSFPQPEERVSENGILDTTLEVAMTDNTIVDEGGGQTTPIQTATYEGNLIGPTLRLLPGDTLKINLINNLPPDPTSSRPGGAFPHNPYTTNLHTHGLTVSPLGIADNVFRQMLPGTENPIEIQIPADHHSGTFWYHPHKHGAVSFQFLGGMSGFLIIEGGEGSLDQVPEVADAREVLMGIQSIMVNAEGITPFVNEGAQQFSSDPATTNGLWGTFQGAQLFLTMNGRVNPFLRLQPGEVQRWRVLNATAGMTLAIALEGHPLNIISQDGIPVAEMITLPAGEAYILGPGNRVDLLVKGEEVGTYLLQALNPRSTPRSISLSGIDPAPRPNNMGADFPQPNYPFTLATIQVGGEVLSMGLPEGPLPFPSGLASTQEVLAATPAAQRQVAFEICGQKGQMMNPGQRLDSCGWYTELYDADYWGGLPFSNLLMMRDAEDVGIPNPSPDPELPRIDYQKDGLFTADTPLFNDMVAGTFEEWTVINRSYSDHPFHIHVNPFLITHINGIELTEPEWRDTILIPAATPNNLPINDPDINYGSVTFRTFLNPAVTGATVIHCHTLTHEDVGMMQRIDLVEP